MDDYQPDRIFYPKRLPIDDTEQKSLEYINNYECSEFSYVKIHDDVVNEDGLIIKEDGDVVIIYIKKGNLALGFFSGCKNDKEKSVILQSFNDKKIEVLITGKEYANEGFIKQIVECIKPNITIGRLNPSVKEDNNDIIGVQSEDIFITKVKDDIVRLRLGNETPIEI